MQGDNYAFIINYLGRDIFGELDGLSQYLYSEGQRRLWYGILNLAKSRISDGCVYFSPVTM
ncbi:MAG: hypothetical protein DMG24_23290 [Acidobacteria bacterium]|nr:MAG: hypothetical protein DMG24_23290 [Acidobacteriota bacterium]